MNASLTVPDFYTSLDEYISSVEMNEESSASHCGRTFNRRVKKRVTYAIPDNLRLDPKLLDQQRDEGVIYDWEFGIYLSGKREVIVTFLFDDRLNRYYN